MELFLCELYQLFHREHICKQVTGFSSVEAFIFRSALPFSVHESLLTPAVPLLLTFSELLIQVL